MNLSTYGSDVIRVYQRLKARLTQAQQVQSSQQIAKRQQQTEAVAHQLYLQRLRIKQGGDESADWQKAEGICLNELRRSLFWLNQPLIRVEKRVIEPVANWLERADLFRIIERTSPAIEALGVIAIPFVLFLAGQQYQERLQQQDSERLQQQDSERLQQQAVKDYLGQISTILLDVDGELSAPENERLRSLTEATTLTLLREPNLDGERKGQVIKFLADMELVNRKPVYGPIRVGDDIPTIKLVGANLRRADLSNVDLIGANLIGADLRDAYLVGSNLIGGTLTFADLRNANLIRADLRNAYLVGANLS